MQEQKFQMKAYDGTMLNLRNIMDSLNHPCLHDVRIIDKQGRIVSVCPSLVAPPTARIIDPVRRCDGDRPAVERELPHAVAQPGAILGVVRELERVLEASWHRLRVRECQGRLP